MLFQFQLLELEIFKRPLKLCKKEWKLLILRDYPESQWEQH